MLLSDFFNEANWYDILWIIALLYGVWSGVRAGFLAEIARVVGWVFILFLAILYYAPTGDWIKGQIGIPEEQARLAAFVMMVLCVYVISMLLRKIINRWISKTTGTPYLQNFGGGFAGIIRMNCAMIFLTIALCLVRSPFWHTQIGKDSKLGSFVVNQIPSVKTVVDREYPETFIFFRDFERPDEVGLEYPRDKKKKPKTATSSH